MVTLLVTEYLMQILLLLYWLVVFVVHDRKNVTKEALENRAIGKYYAGLKLNVAVFSVTQWKLLTV